MLIYPSKYLLFASALLIIASCTPHLNQIHSEAEQGSFPEDNTMSHNLISHSGVLRLVSLNVAHGRKDATNQLLVSKGQIQQNLKEIANTLVKQDADVVALQEADGPSSWSGSFDHVEFIAKHASYSWHYRADNAHSWLFNYGTAILSRWPIAETLAYNFKPSPPTVNKGFLLTRVKWWPDAESDQEINIDIISVHLDFSRQTVREKQIAEMRELLIARDNPLIILGDFNSDWFTEKSVIKTLAEKGELQVYKPLADNLSTYGDNHRLDWILISRELEFIVYQVLPDKLSDHLMLVADIQLKNTQAIDK